MHEGRIRWIWQKLYPEANDLVSSAIRKELSFLGRPS